MRPSSLSDVGKVLVANRGEIAVRIFRTCRDLNVRTVAVYSEADREALHVMLADESYYIGPSEPLKSYLDVERIIAAARKAGAEAIHPGYGFLSQNAFFAERVIEEGFIWVGPEPQTISLVGDKLGARKFFSQRGMQVVPGTLEAVDERDAASVAEEIGFPVVVKPAGGGGGIGMFIANSAKEIDEYIRMSRELVKASFGRHELYIEKYYPKAKHIEVQIIGDKRGNILHLYERECSVQRKYQKVVEEAPSPSISQEERNRVLRMALEAAKAVNYTSAGTFEFLFDTQGRNFFLLEVNPRIQVEHPVTELVTGMDIVELQLRIATGEALQFKQEEVVLKGHSIEARVYAEDPTANFMPSPGKIVFLQLPGGPWIRVDSGVYEGYEVPPFYDPLLMKVVSYGSTRIQAIARLKRGLQELKISGVRHNKYLALRVLEDQRFIDASHTTRLLDDPSLYENIQNEDPRPEVAPKLAMREESFKLDREDRAQEVRVNAWRIVSRMRYDT
jgi:acetyl-CoA carboxylase biotin carboxylase subunit